MINLNSYLEIISIRNGYEVYTDPDLENAAGVQIVRFRIESDQNTFHLKLSRSWKTTRIDFVPGPFATQIVDYLCDEVILHKTELSNLFRTQSASVSDFALEIDGKNYDQLESLEKRPHKLNLYIETMTPESSIGHGLLNEKEANLLDLATSVISLLLPPPSKAYSSPDEVVGFPEGAATQVLVNRYERDPRNRASAISAHGYQCLACGFDFKINYGELGSDFIVVHHVVPVSQIGPDYMIDPVKDLITLCANCHAMIHREDPPLSLDQLRKIISFKPGS